MRKWSGMKIVVIGAARQGLALARYLVRHGAWVVLTDMRSSETLRLAQESLADLPTSDNRRQAGINWVCGGHPLSLLDGADLVCPSGGVPLDLPLVEEALRRGILLSNDSQIFLEAAPCRVIGITGSAGKTTTTTLVGRIAQVEYGAPNRLGKVYVGGNIGNPLIAFVDEMTVDDLVIMELSSFQLDIMTISPQVAAILNITPNHLDRHRTMAAYSQAKAKILAFQDAEGIAVLNRDDPGSWELRHHLQGELLSFGVHLPGTEETGTFLNDEMISLWRGGQVIDLIRRDVIGLKGRHNLVNVLAACAIAYAAGLSNSAMRQGIAGFAGVKHRLEFVRSWGGGDWYNDSIATAPERVMADIQAFEEPLIVLAGGRDKNLPWDGFSRLVRSRVKHLVLFGEAAAIIQRSLEAQPSKPEDRLESVRVCRGLAQAVAEAAKLLQPGMVVLLSPGGTSFDEFHDFEERGECFTNLVNNL